MIFTSFNRNMTDATRGAGTAYPSREPDFILDFLRDSCCSFISFLCSVLEIIVGPFVLFLLVIALSVLLLLRYLQNLLT